MDHATLQQLGDTLETYLSEFDDCFARCDTRRHLGVFVRGQLGPLQRKSVEPIALAAGVAPRTLQEFVGFHRWDEALMRSRVREIVAREHGHVSSVGVIDETTFPKSGTKTTGVQRQYCGATGKNDNCVATVELTYAAGTFATIVDGDIYIPETWIADTERCAEAGVPEDLAFRKKSDIALDLIDRSRHDGIELRWVTADEFYGRSFEFIEALEERGLQYVVEVPVITWGWTPRGIAKGREHRRIDDLFRRGGPPWIDYKIKETTKGPLVWRARATRFVRRQGANDRTKELWLIIAENILTEETKYFLSNAPANTPIATLLAVAFTRWNVERNFQDSKQEIGLDHFEVRTYRAVQRHLALSMVSLLFLVRTRERLNKKKAHPETAAGRFARCATS